MNNITAVILTYNEVNTIEVAINSVLDCCEEVLIIDSGSNDGTLEVLKKYSSIRVIFNKFKNFSEQRNFGISQTNSPWILFLDADEKIDSNLKKSLNTSILKSGYAYKFSRKNHIWGDWLVDGIGRDLQIRLFENNGIIKYEREVHEILINYRKSELLPGEILHFQNSNLNILIAKQNKYTDFEIETGEYDRDSMFKLFFRPWYVLIKHILIYKGWRAGLKGFCWALIVCNYEILKTLKILERRCKWNDK